MIDLLQVILTVGNIVAFFATASGRYRTGFTIGAAMQPGWFYLGWETGAWCNAVLALFYLGGSMWGIHRETRVLKELRNVDPFGFYGKTK